MQSRKLLPYEYEAQLFQAPAARAHPTTSGQSRIRCDLVLPSLPSPCFVLCLVPAGGACPFHKIESNRFLFGKRTTYDNPWAPGLTEKSLGDLSKVMRNGDMGAVPTEQETQKDLPPAEVRFCRAFVEVACCDHPTFAPGVFPLWTLTVPLCAVAGSL